jgi:hypothetical protein
MALMLSKTYEALVTAGAPEDKAREAAEEIASYENRLTRMESYIAQIKAEMTTKTFVPTAMLTQTFALLGRQSGAAPHTALIPLCVFHPTSAAPR